MLHANCVLSMQIAGKINRIIRELGLRELGQLEQDLVFGDAGTKDVIKFMTTKEVKFIVNYNWTVTTFHYIYKIAIPLMQDATRENKLRLLMILAAIYPDKFEGEKGLNLMKVGLLFFLFQWIAICYTFFWGQSADLLLIISFLTWCYLTMLCYAYQYSSIVWISSAGKITTGWYECCAQYEIACGIIRHQKKFNWRFHSEVWHS